MSFEKSDLLVVALKPDNAGGAKGMKSSESRQRSFVFADSSKEGEREPKADESPGSSCLLHQANLKKTNETDAQADSRERLLERVASLPNQARTLLMVARNKGAPGVDGQTVDEVVEAAPELLPELRLALISGSWGKSTGRCQSCLARS